MTGTPFRRAQDVPTQCYQLGQRITGRYLGHRFTGTIRATRQMAHGHHALTLRFDAPIDVVRSAQFSSLRRQVNCVVDRHGRTHARTSDGVPHVQIDDAWAGG